MGNRACVHSHGLMSPVAGTDFVKPVLQATEQFCRNWLPGPVQLSQVDRLACAPLLCLSEIASSGTSGHFMMLHFSKPLKPWWLSSGPCDTRKMDAGAA